MPPDKRSGPEGPPRLAAAKQTSTKIVPDRRDAERWRAACELEQRQLASMVTYYCAPRLRAIPLGQFLVEGWWPA